MKTRKKLPPGVILGILGGVLLLVILFSFPLGRYPVSVPQLVQQLMSGLFGTPAPADENLARVIYRIRLPRILLAVLAGGSLSAAGAAYQGVFQNPMASPDLLGASSGASFGAALGIILGLPSGGVTGLAFFMSLLTVLAAWLVSRASKGSRVMTLVLSGMMVSSLFTAGTSYLKLVADPEDQLQEITYWLMGSLSGADWGDFRTAILPAAIGITILLLLRWRLGVLTLGDEEAEALGVKPERMRAAAVLAATLLTAAAIASCGTIGWVGLIIPHLAGRLTGQSYRYRLTGSILLGGAFLLAADNIARSALPVEIPIGILTAFAGAPFFLWLMVKGGRKG